MPSISRNRRYGAAMTLSVATATAGPPAALAYTVKPVKGAATRSLSARIASGNRVIARAIAALRV